MKCPGHAVLLGSYRSNPFGQHAWYPWCLMTTGLRCHQPITSGRNAGPARWTTLAWLMSVHSLATPGLRTTRNGSVASSKSPAGVSVATVTSRRSPSARASCSARVLTDDSTPPILGAKANV